MTALLKLALVTTALTLPLTTAFAADETIAAFTKNQVDPFFDEVRTGVDKAASNLGATTTHYVPTKPNNIAEGTAQLEDVVTAKPDLVLFLPLDPQAQLPAIQRVIDLGIPVVNYIDRAGKADFITYVGQDDVTLAYMVAKQLFDHLGGKGNIIILEGIAGNATAEDRNDGFEKALAEYPDIKLLASQPANYQRLQGLQVTENLMQQHQQIDGIIAAADAMGLGAVEALEAGGRSGVPVVTIDGITEAVEAVRDGRILAIAEFSGFKMGCLAVDVGLRGVRGETVPDEIILPSALITKDNYADWLTPLSERECPTLEDVPTVN